MGKCLENLMRKLQPWSMECGNVSPVSVVIRVAQRKSYPAYLLRLMVNEERDESCCFVSVLGSCGRPLELMLDTLARGTASLGASPFAVFFFFFDIGRV